MERRNTCGAHLVESARYSDTDTVAKNCTDCVVLLNVGFLNYFCFANNSRLAESLRYCNTDIVANCTACFDLKCFFLADDSLASYSDSEQVLKKK